MKRCIPCILFAILLSGCKEIREVSIDEAFETFSTNYGIYKPENIRDGKIVVIREEWLVLYYTLIDGYNLFNFILASSVVNRQSTFASAVLRINCQAATSSFNCSLLSILRDKHCRDKIPSSISAISSQLPCFGA